MVESGPTSVMKKASSKASTTAIASRFWARVGDKLERMKFCSSGSATALFTIGATLRSGWKGAARSSCGFATLVTRCLGSPPFPSIVPTDDEQGGVAASEKARLARFPAAVHVTAPATDLRTLFRSIVPALPGPIGHPRDLSVSRLRVEIVIW